MSARAQCACPSVDADRCLEMRHPCGCWIEYGTEHAPDCLNFEEECSCACHEERRAEMREQEDYENELEDSRRRDRGRA